MENQLMEMLPQELFIIGLTILIAVGSLIAITWLVMKLKR